MINLYACVMAEGVMYPKGEYKKALVMAKNKKEARILMAINTMMSEWLLSKYADINKIAEVPFEVPFNESKILHGEYHV